MSDIFLGISKISDAFLELRCVSFSSSSYVRLPKSGTES
jgi:hypothetical protein